MSWLTLSFYPKTRGNHDSVSAAVPHHADADALNVLRKVAFPSQGDPDRCHDVLDDATPRPTPVPALPPAPVESLPARDQDKRRVA